MARQIRRGITAAKVVALSLSTQPDRIRRTVGILQMVHLARAADAMTPAGVQRLRDQLAPVEVMVTIPVRGPEAVGVARRFAEVSDYLLLDTADPATGVVGATGVVHDWSVSASVVEAVSVPTFLAGGLGPGNVVDAIRRVRPAGVDSETRTSRQSDRRRKDPERVRAFVELARSVKRCVEVPEGGLSGPAGGPAYP